MDQDSSRDRMVFVGGQNRKGRRIQDLTVSTRVWLGGQGRGNGRVRGVRLSAATGLVEIAVRFEDDGKEETFTLPWDEFVPLAWDVGDRA